MYDNREIPPRQIPAMEHIYTKRLPDDMLGYFEYFPKAVLSGKPEDTSVLLIRYTTTETVNPEHNLLFLSRDYITVLSNDTGADPWYLMRHEQGLGFALPTGNTATRALYEINFSVNNSAILTNEYFTYGTNNNNISSLSTARIPLYDFQNKRYIVLGYNDTDLGISLYDSITTAFTSPVNFYDVTARLKDAFSFLDNSTYPNTSFWNGGSFSIEQAETLSIERLLLLRITKRSALTNLTESYLFLFDTNSSTIVGPRRVLVPLPSVLFKDDAGVPWVLQAASKDRYSTTFQLLDRTLAIKKKIVVYGNSVYPLGIQTIHGVNGLVFLTSAARWGTPTLYFSLFFLPLSKLGGL